VEACRESNADKFPNPQKPFPKRVPVIRPYHLLEYSSSGLRDAFSSGGGMGPEHQKTVDKNPLNHYG
jgi:hypothetical protein